ncbi:hypothetical protein GGS21DRAFT_290782 [Xylaria nigripes]|nr:hypothetical protein GGS21DRAFT_290782 [Xylaria nigripes]
MTYYALCSALFCSVLRFFVSVLVLPQYNAPGYYTASFSLPFHPQLPCPSPSSSRLVPTYPSFPSLILFFFSFPYIRQHARSRSWTSDALSRSDLSWLPILGIQQSYTYLPTIPGPLQVIVSAHLCPLPSPQSPSQVSLFCTCSIIRDIQKHLRAACDHKPSFREARGNLPSSPWTHSPTLWFPHPGPPILPLIVLLSIRSLNLFVGFFQSLFSDLP